MRLLWNTGTLENAQIEMEGKSNVITSDKLPIVPPNVTERRELVDNPVELRQEMEESEDHQVFSAAELVTRATRNRYIDSRQNMNEWSIETQNGCDRWIFWSRASVNRIIERNAWLVVMTRISEVSLTANEEANPDRLVQVIAESDDHSETSDVV